MTLRLNVPLLVTLTLGIVFAVATLQKGRNWRQFAAAIDDYALLPAPLVVPTTVAVLLTEAALAVLHLASSIAWWTPALGLALCAVFAWAQLLRRLTNPGAPCYCFGAHDQEPVGWRSILRLSVVAAAEAALLVLVRQAPHQFTALDWIGHYVLACLTFALAWWLLHADAAWQLISRDSSSGQLRRLRSHMGATGAVIVVFTAWASVVHAAPERLGVSATHARDQQERGPGLRVVELAATKGREVGISRYRVSRATPALLTSVHVELIGDDGQTIGKWTQNTQYQQQQGRLSKTLETMVLHWQGTAITVSTDHSSRIISLSVGDGPPLTATLGSSEPSDPFRLALALNASVLRVGELVSLDVGAMSP